MILADKITEERKKNGWSQEELSNQLGVSRQAVFRNTLIEVDCDVDNGLYKWKPTRRTEWKIIVRNPNKK